MVYLIKTAQILQTRPFQTFSLYALATISMITALCRIYLHALSIR